MSRDKPGWTLEVSDFRLAAGACRRRYDSPVSDEHPLGKTYPCMVHNSGARHFYVGNLLWKFIMEDGHTEILDEEEE